MNLPSPVWSKLDIKSVFAEINVLRAPKIAVFSSQTCYALVQKSPSSPCFDLSPPTLPLHRQASKCSHGDVSETLVDNSHYPLSLSSPLALDNNADNPGFASLVNSALQKVHAPVLGVLAVEEELQL